MLQIGCYKSSGKKNCTARAPFGLLTASPQNEEALAINRSIAGTFALFTVHLLEMSGFHTMIKNAASDILKQRKGSRVRHSVDRPTHVHPAKNMEEGGFNGSDFEADEMEGEIFDGLKEDVPSQTMDTSNTSYFFHAR